jgi:hypothetical protein
MSVISVAWYLTLALTAVVIKYGLHNAIDRSIALSQAAARDGIGPIVPGPQ